MKIQVEYDTFNKALNAVVRATNDRMTADDYRNVIFWVKNGVLTLVGINSAVMTMVVVDCIDMSGAVDEEIYQIRSKELERIVSAYKGLTRTKPKDINIRFDSGRAEIKVSEEKLSGVTLDEYIYNQSTKFVTMLIPVQERVKMKMGMADKYKSSEEVKIQTSAINRYLGLLAGPIVKEGRDNAATRLYCFDNKMMTMPYMYAVVMNNDLPKYFNDFVMTYKVVGYLNDFVNEGEDISFSKYDADEGIVLKVDNGYATAYLTVLKVNDNFGVPNGIGDMDKGDKVIVDKYYFRDVLKRLDVTDMGSGGMVGIKVDLDNGVFIAQTKTVKLGVPLQSYTGQGVYNFAISIPLLGELINNKPYLQSDIEIYFNKDDREDDRLGLTITDSSVSKNGNKLWYIGLRGLECDIIDTLVDEAENVEDAEEEAVESVEQE